MSFHTSNWSDCYRTCVQLCRQYKVLAHLSQLFIGRRWAMSNKHPTLPHWSVSVHTSNWSDCYRTCVQLSQYKVLAHLELSQLFIGRWWAMSNKHTTLPHWVLCHSTLPIGAIAIALVFNYVVNIKYWPTYPSCSLDVDEQCPINIPPSLTESCVIPHFQLEWLLSHLCSIMSSI